MMFHTKEFKQGWEIVKILTHISDNINLFCKLWNHLTEIA